METGASSPITRPGWSRFEPHCRVNTTGSTRSTSSTWPKKCWVLDISAIYMIHYGISWHAVTCPNLPMINSSYGCFGHSQGASRQPIAATPLRSPLEGALEAFHSRWDLMSCAQPDLSDQVFYVYLIFGWNRRTYLCTQSSFLDMDVNNMAMELVLSNTAMLGRTWLPSSQLCFLHLEELQLDRLPLHQLPCSAAGWACITLCFGQ